MYNIVNLNFNTLREQKGIGIRKNMLQRFNFMKKNMKINYKCELLTVRIHGIQVKKYKI